MKFRIVAVGKIKEAYLRDAIAEYVKRISRFATVEIVEVDEFLIKGTPNDKEIDRVKYVEGQAILNKLDGYVVAMDIDGREMSSTELSAHIVQEKQFFSTFTFVIGGSNGLSDAVKSKANLRCSFGKITLPHQLFRVVLMEQLYRACCIEHNVAYHK
ncbi:MAG: 23S rRNA (pseudouridine(1915)-N(3))-methyltransferase RlmH [Clostridiales bacterium]|nr:23S rRNA (pseudouridine(1915)-N(3))-methyltransferase RlmH [Clostridiales bacterium]